MMRLPISLSTAFPVILSASLPAVALLSLSLATLLPARAADPCPVNPNVRGHENVEWSIGYGFHLTDAQKGLPRVLLVGDSICNGYQGAVQKRLEGKVNVSYWVSSYCLTMPAYRKLLDFYLSEAKYDVVHFNNGLHSLGTDPALWERELESCLRTIRAAQPQAQLVWCSSTPLKDPKLTAKAAALNAAGARVAAKLGVPCDDLFGLLDPLDREANWSDTFHHKGPVREREADQVAASVLTALGK